MPRAYPSKIKVRFIVATDAIVDNLQLFSRVHSKSSERLHPLVDGVHVVVLFGLQPGRFADAIVGSLQLTRLVVLHGSSFELQQVEQSAHKLTQ